MATIQVTTAADVVDEFDGLTSFRVALHQVNVSVGTDTIAFDNLPEDQTTIRLTKSVGVTDGIFIERDQRDVGLSVDASGNGDSNGETAHGLDEDAVIFSLGGAASTALEMCESGWNGTPSIGLTMAENTERSDRPTLGGRVGLGLLHPSGASGSLSAGYSGVGGDARNFTVSFNVSFPFN